MSTANDPNSVDNRSTKRPPSLAAVCVELICANAVASVAAFGAAAAIGTARVAEAVAVAAAVMVLPGLLLVAVLGCTGLRRPVVTVAIFSFARPAIGLAAVVAVDRSAPEMRAAFLIAIALTYVASLIVETRFLTRLTATPDANRVRPRNGTETPTDG